MVALLSRLVLVVRSGFKSQARLKVENIVLRQQVIVLNRKSRRRMSLQNFDRLLLVWLYRLFPWLLDAIVIVKHETLICWHRRGFCAYRRWKARHLGGSPRIDSEMRGLIPRMNRENPFIHANC